ncbi:MAG: hypothetical protein AAGF49_15535 [Pseudomonadota bacterium]
MPVEKDPTAARQGERGKSMLWVMVLSTGAAIVIALGAYAFVYNAEEEVLQGDPPASEAAAPAVN